MTDLFNEEAPQDKPKEPENQAAPESPPADPFASLLGEIKNQEGEQKYADVETALKSVAHAEGTIAELRNKVKQMEDQLVQAKSTEELAASLGKHTPNEPNEQPSGGEQGIDVEALVEAALAKREQEKTASEQADTRKSNAENVRDSLRETYGDKAGEVFKEKAEELGLTADELVSLAQDKPQLVLKQFTKKAPQPNSMVGGVNTSNLSNTPAPTLTPPKGRTAKDMVASYREHEQAILNQS